MTDQRMAEQVEESLGGKHIKLPRYRYRIQEDGTFRLDRKTGLFWLRMAYRSIHGREGDVQQDKNFPSESKVLQAIGADIDAFKAQARKQEEARVRLRNAQWKEYDTSDLGAL